WEVRMSGASGSFSSAGTRRCWMSRPRAARCRTRHRGGAGTARKRSDLADQVQRRGQGLFAFLPLGRADLVRVGGDVLGGLQLAQGLRHVTGDGVVVDL